MMSIQPEIKILVGVPGSGKSTWVNEYLSGQGDGREWVVVSVDDIIEAKCRKAGLSYTDGYSRYVDEAVNLHEFILGWAIKNNHNIIVDRTNLTPATRRRILARVPRNYKKTAVNFIADAETLQQRLQSVARQQKIIPGDVLDQMRRQLVFASPREGFAEVATIRAEKSMPSSSATTLLSRPDWPALFYEKELGFAMEKAGRASLEGDEIVMKLYLGKAQRYAQEINKDISAQTNAIRQNLTQERIVGRLQRLLEMRFKQAQKASTKGNQALTDYYLNDIRSIAEKLRSYNIRMNINTKCQEISHQLSEERVCRFFEAQLKENLLEAEKCADNGDADAMVFHLDVAQKAVDKLTDFVQSLAEFEIQFQNIRSKLTPQNKEKFILSKIEELLESAESVGQCEYLRLQYSYFQEALKYASKLNLDISKRITAIIGMPYEAYASKFKAC